jgi:acetylxylan esterase
MFFKATTILMVARAIASPLDGPQVQKRQCPDIHVFGARETTVASGYGSSITVVDDVLAYYSGSTAEAINYPACGGQASCGDISYAESALEGAAAVASQVNTFNNECPDTILVLVGYSQVSTLNTIFL